MTEAARPETDTVVSFMRPLKVLVGEVTVYLAAPVPTVSLASAPSVTVPNVLLPSARLKVAACPDAVAVTCSWYLPGDTWTALAVKPAVVFALIAATASASVGFALSAPAAVMGMFVTTPPTVTFTDVAPYAASVPTHGVGFVVTIEWFAAIRSTLKVSAPGVADVPAAAVTEVDELDALAAVHVAGFWTASAAARRASKRVLMARYAVALACVLESWFFSRVCGFASTCISWLISAPVSIPETRPVLTLMPAMSCPPESGSRAIEGWARGEGGGGEPPPSPRGARCYCSDQPRSLRMPCGAWLAWASMAVPAWVRICVRVKLVISCAMSVSRMRLSDARQVLHRHVEVVDGVLEPVLDGTQIGAGRWTPS